MTYTVEEIRRMYRGCAGGIDQAEALQERLLLRHRRRRLVRWARGEVLEVAVGTARNLPFYPRGCALTAVDVSPEMLAQARKRVADAGMEVTFLEADAEMLPFPDRAFDTVVSTMSLCTFPHPVRALEEMSRVCRPQGRILLLEHGRSAWPLLGPLQDRTAERQAAVDGCWWNRRPLELVRQAGLVIEGARSAFGGLIVEIRARPMSDEP